VTSVSPAARRDHDLRYPPGVAGKSQRPGAGRGKSQRRRRATVRPGASGGPTAAAEARLAVATRAPALPDAHAGDGIILLSWASVALFVIATVPAAFGVSALDGVAVGVPFALFLVGTGIMVWSFVLGLARTTRGDNVVVANLYLLAGSAPRRVQAHLFGALTASIIAAAALAAWNPAVVLVPILPLGLNGLWAVRHGTFPPRPARGDGGRERALSPAERNRGGRPGQ
jgi:uncharacterized membrane protein YtjA (UPF0391 family)